ncbi:prenyltransferase/squalene oxidase repeat-containing protein [Nocardia sp. JMUB6875]|uniref:prenyltransferase/squalene oxidase repeat-containing protein n=1 Tax=Nocardia sp. JMUB6875 TaxID=3158170 RepID=UPI0034E8F702
MSLLEESLADPLGIVDGGYYDTGQVVRQWARYPERIPASVGRCGLEFLMRVQNPDGSWGNAHWPVSYRLVPSLGALVGLVETINRPTIASHSIWQATNAVRRALEFLTADPARFSPAALPDTVAVELVVPAMLSDLREALAAVPIGDMHLRFLARVDEALAACGPYLDRLRALRTAAHGGHPLPVHMCHSLEVLGTVPSALARPFGSDGPVGCSPAATATVLGWSQGRSSASIDFLTSQAARCGGAQPDVLPIAVFERSWAIGALLRLGLPIPHTLRDQCAASLAQSLNPSGVALGPGMPVDGDLTSTILFLLPQLGLPIAPTCLLNFDEGGEAFCNYFGERTASVTTNAHMLEAFGGWQEHLPPEGHLFEPARAKITRFLLDAQGPDGCWTDKWHASPIYATACTTPALRSYGGPLASGAVTRAVRWLMDTQRFDGSWGLWHGTLEDTAHALHTLFLCGQFCADITHLTAAITHGVQFLTNNADAQSSDPVRTPLWHGKELFQPERISRMVILSALARYSISHESDSPPGSLSLGRTRQSSR